MILTDTDMDLYRGPLDEDIPFNYKSKLFKATFESQKGNIKVCPHCNGTKFHMKDSSDNNSRYISVVCSSCKTIGPRSRYNVWHTGNLAEWHLYDENMVDITKDEVIKKAIDLWNNGC